MVLALLYVLRVVWGPVARSYWKAAYLGKVCAQGVCFGGIAGGACGLWRCARQQLDGCCCVHGDDEWRMAGCEADGPAGKGPAVRHFQSKQ
jgi:hypothetical protein